MSYTSTILAIAVLSSVLLVLHANPTRYDASGRETFASSGNGNGNGGRVVNHLPVDHNRRGAQENMAKKDVGNTPSPMQRIFFSATNCVDKCLQPCQSMSTEQDTTLYVCPRLKPVEKSLHERFIANASWPWILFLVVLGVSLLFCCGCICWSCCCREGGCCGGNGGRGRDSNSSREPLASNRRIEEIISEHPNPHASPNNRLISGSKYVVDV